MNKEITKEQVIEWIKENDLEGANLWRANLTGTNLRGANLWRADLRWADLEGADLQGADLTDTTFKDNYIWKDGKKVKVDVIIKEIE